MGIRWGLNGRAYIFRPYGANRYRSSSGGARHFSRFGGQGGMLASTQRAAVSRSRSLTASLTFSPRWAALR